jgi:Na+/proline symporter
VLVFILVLLALFLGMIVKEQLFWLVLIAWAGLGASLGPTSILALYWRKTTKNGAIAGIISGTLITVIWYYTPWLKELIYELVPAFIMGFLATIAVSFFSSKPPDTEKMFDIMKGIRKGDT